MSMHIYLALLVEPTLFHIRFDLVVSPVVVLEYPGYAMKLPSTVNLVRVGSFFLAVVYHNVSICNVFVDLNWDIVILHEGNSVFSLESFA